MGFPPKSSILIGFNRVFHDFHHPFWGTRIFGNTPMSSRFFFGVDTEVMWMIWTKKFVM